MTNIEVSRKSDDVKSTTQMTDDSDFSRPMFSQLIIIIIIIIIVVVVVTYIHNAR